MGKILKADESYSAVLRSFTIRDSLIAIAYYLFLMVGFYLMGKVYAASEIYLGVPVSIAFMMIPIVICRHNVSSVGISSRNLAPAVLVSCVLGGLLLSLFSIVPGIIHHRQWLPAKDIAYNIFYYFVIIALTEELGFRGFIQPRLMPLLKREWLSIVVGGLLFVFMHYPFQMAARDMTLREYWPLFIANASFQFMWHFVFTWFFRRYGNIFGGTIFHGLLDLSNGLFVG